MCNHRRKDKNKSKVNGNKVRVTLIEDKVLETQLRWFGPWIKINGGSCEGVNGMEQVISKRCKGRQKKKKKKLVGDT